MTILEKANQFPPAVCRLFATPATTRQIALRSGLISLQHDGFRKVREGITTIEEIFQATGDIRDAGAAPSAPVASPQPAAPNP